MVKRGAATRLCMYDIEEHTILGTSVQNKNSRRAVTCCVTLEGIRNTALVGGAGRATAVVQLVL